MSYQVIFFDLDGTLVNSGPGIMKSAQHALDHFGYANQTTEQLQRFIGPALMDTFMHVYGLTKEQAREAVELYRKMYDDGEKFDSKVYTGIPEVLEKLMQAKKDCMLVTSKPAYFARQILDHFQLAEYFPYIASPKLTATSSDKTYLLRRALEENHLDRQDVIMIGDTRFDIDGAKGAGVDSIGVTYGYGSREELTEAGVDYLVDSPEEILKIPGIL